jgi:hypothetical protein
MCCLQTAQIISTFAFENISSSHFLCPSLKIINFNYSCHNLVIRTNLRLVSRCAIPGQRPSVNYAPVQPQFSGHPSFVSSQPQPQIQVQGVQPQQWTGQTATRTQTQTWAPQPAATPQLQTVPIQSEVSAALPATITQPRSLPAAPATEVPTIMVANSTALPTTSTSPLNSSVEMTMRLLSQTLSAPGTVEWTTTRPENIILTVEPNATSPLTTMKPYLNWNNRSAESKEGE